MGISAALVENFINLEMLAGIKCLGGWDLYIWQELVPCHEQEVFELFQCKLLD